MPVVRLWELSASQAAGRQRIETYDPVWVARVLKHKDFAVVAPEVACGVLSEEVLNIGVSRTSEVGDGVFRTERDGS